MGRLRCRRVNDINYKALINQNYNLEVSYTSVLIDGIYYCAASHCLVAVCVERWRQEKLNHTQDGMKETRQSILKH